MARWIVARIEIGLTIGKYEIREEANSPKRKAPSK
jgi:hypothetical protein